MQKAKSNKQQANFKKQKAKKQKTEGKEPKSKKYDQIVEPAWPSYYCYLKRSQKTGAKY